MLSNLKAGLGSRTSGRTSHSDGFPRSISVGAKLSLSAPRLFHIRLPSIRSSASLRARRQGVELHRSTYLRRRHTVSPTVLWRTTRAQFHFLDILFNFICIGRQGPYIDALDTLPIWCCRPFEVLLPGRTCHVIKVTTIDWA